MPFLSLVFNLVVLLSANLSRPDIALLETKKAAANITKATGIGFHIRSRVASPLPYQDVGPYFETAYSYFHRVEWPTPKRHTIYLYLAPPERNFAGQDVPNGAAFLCGIKNQKPFAYATVVSGSIAIGAPDISGLVTRYVIEHELLHVFGALHTGSVTVMSPGNFAWLSNRHSRLIIHHNTIRKVRKCLAKA